MRLVPTAILRETLEESSYQMCSDAHAPIPKADERIALPERYKLPSEFPTTSPSSGLLHHLEGPIVDSRPIPKSDEKLARQERYELPTEFPLTSPFSSIFQHLLLLLKLLPRLVGLGSAGRFVRGTGGS